MFILYFVQVIQEHTYCSSRILSPAAGKSFDDTRTFKFFVIVLFATELVGNVTKTTASK